MRLDLSAQTLFIIPKFFLNRRAVVLSRPPALDYHRPPDRSHRNSRSRRQGRRGRDGLVRPTDL